MTYKTRKEPIFSACGLNCGLCPRFYTKGSSRCPGCGGEGFTQAHCGCGTLSCCERKNVEYCCFCDEFPCKKYIGADESDSFITHINQFKDFEKAGRIGIDAYISELKEKIKLLEILLENYDNGRRKSFFCLAVNLLDLQDIKAVMERINPDNAVSLFEEIAGQKNITLKLRRNKNA
ncbi:MAG: DUF3795 domain-containing protein [Oscillospiraceae bacterium]|nr:DUF3795 domain-containing protein [Oscillospiraceae bacterium]